MGSWGHPSIPFLAAAIAALFLYRCMVSFVGLDNRVIFAVSVTVAAVLAAGWLAAHLVWPLRKE